MGVWKKMQKFEDTVKASKMARSSCKCCPHSLFSAFGKHNLVLCWINCRFLCYSSQYSIASIKFISKPFGGNSHTRRLLVILCASLCVDCLKFQLLLFLKANIVVSKNHFSATVLYCTQMEPLSRSLLFYHLTITEIIGYHRPLIIFNQLVWSCLPFPAYFLWCYVTLQLMFWILEQVTCTSHFIRDFSRSVQAMVEGLQDYRSWRASLVWSKDWQVD